MVTVVPIVCPSHTFNKLPSLFISNTMIGKLFSWQSVKAVISITFKPLSYTSDPEKNADAVKFDFISFEDVLAKGLNVMDTTAFTLSQENKLPIIVFDMNKKGNLAKICSGETVGTIVTI